MAVRIVELALTMAIISVVIIIAVTVVIVDIMLIDRNASIGAAANSGANGRNVATGADCSNRSYLRNEDQVAIGVSGDVCEFDDCGIFSIRTFVSAFTTPSAAFWVAPVGHGTLSVAQSLLAPR